MRQINALKFLRSGAIRGCILAAGLLMLGALSGCVVAGFSSQGGWFIWPGGLGFLFIILLLFFFLRRRR